MRAQRGLSQSDLADAAGVSRKTIIELEKGAAGISFGTVVAVLESMGGELSVVSASKPTTAEVQSLLGLGPFQSHLGRDAGAQAVGTIRSSAGLRVSTTGIGSAGKPAEDT